METTPEPEAQQQPEAMSTDLSPGVVADQQQADQVMGSAEQQAEQQEAQAEPEVPTNPVLVQYNEQWKKVSETPHDFTAWTALITTAEKLDDLERLRAVYEPFLAAYPLCYGYWKKYADAEHRHQNIEAAMAVYEKGVNATPYSPDLWIHYATYKKANDGSTDDIRGIYERALVYCGSDYVAHSLWEKYIAFEEGQGSALHVAALYSRALGQPLRELNRMMTSLRTYVQTRTSAEVMTPEETAALMEHLTKEKEAHAAAAKAEAEAAAAAAAESGAEPPAEQPVIDTSVSDEEIKAAWLTQREMFMDGARKVADARRSYEEGIKRSYFHVKPLDTPQLLNWVRYLDHVEEGDDLASAVVVYERCLVACASYPEYWQRYIRWLDSKDMSAEADGALQRAINVFCIIRPEIYLYAARHEERRGQADQARAHYKHVLDKLAPGLIQAVVEYANFERRQGQLDTAVSIWESALESEKTGSKSDANSTEAGSAAATATATGSKSYPFMAMHFATFLSEVCRKPERARDVLKEALGAAPHVRNLWEAAIHLELSTGGEGMYDRVAALFECACAEPGEGSPGLTEKDREEMSIRFVEFVDMHGDAAALKKAEAAHAARFTLPTSFAAAAAAAGADTGRKRTADATPGDGSASKMPRMDAGYGAAAHAPAAAAPPAAYHHYPPAPAAAAPPAAYPYPAPAAGGYAGYPAYSSYGHYGHYGY